MPVGARFNSIGEDIQTQQQARINSLYNNKEEKIGSNSNIHNKSQTISKQESAMIEASQPKHASSLKRMPVIGTKNT